MLKNKTKYKFCRYCFKRFLAARINQVFCSADHRKTFWLERRAENIPAAEFKEFLAWKAKQKKINNR